MTHFDGLGYCLVHVEYHTNVCTERQLGEDGS